MGSGSRPESALNAHPFLMVQKVDRQKIRPPVPTIEYRQQHIPSRIPLNALPYNPHFLLPQTLLLLRHNNPSYSTPLAELKHTDDVSYYLLLNFFLVE